MSAYHARESFEKRMAERRAPPAPLAVFYHIACLPTWQAIVTEQMRLLGHVGLANATACVLGTAEDADWCRMLARRVGVDLMIAGVSPDLHEFEHPTLCEVYRWANANPTGAVLYLHTKGASVPNCPIKRQWRRVMQKHVVADWRTNLQRAALADFLGVAWQRSPGLPHFCGNFWLARCDWLRELPDPHAYRLCHRRHSWWRIHAEAWIGSMPGHRVESLCWDGMLWSSRQVFSFTTHVAGFAYDQDCDFGPLTTPATITVSS